VPVHVCAAKDGLPEFYTGQLRDSCRTGILFHSQISFEPGTNLELTFCLPPEQERPTCVLARASSTALGAWALPGAPTLLYGIAVVIEQIHFFRPDAPGGA
jgi:hypothetical protein